MPTQFSHWSVESRSRRQPPAFWNQCTGKTRRQGEHSQIPFIFKSPPPYSIISVPWLMEPIHKTEQSIMGILTWYKVVLEGWSFCWVEGFFNIVDACSLCCSCSATNQTSYHLFPSTGKRDNNQVWKGCQLQVCRKANYLAGRDILAVGAVRQCQSKIMSRNH